MADRERSVEEIYEVALDLPPERRAAYLDRACRESDGLRAAVEHLLSADGRLGSFLADPPFAAETADTASAADSSGSSNLAAVSKLGRYTIIEPLGEGGMGMVYRARDEKLERTVAIKVIFPGMVTGHEARRRFRREGLALARLSHTHIAAVYDVGEQDGIDYIVMECVPGETLADKLKGGPLTIKEATSILLQIAEALEEAHEQGIVHRDLKPANVIVTPKGQVKVLDFGIAKLLASQPADLTLSVETRGMVGTPLYMSPEQAHGKPADTRTDIWGLGVVYYELLTGLRPFRANSSLAVLRAITEEQPTPVRELRPDAPALAEQIVTRALAKDPAERYQSAAEVVLDASKVLGGLSTTSGDRDDRRKGVWWTAVAAAILVIAVALGAAFWMYQMSGRKRWAREEAPAQIERLIAARKPLAAFLVLEKAQKYLPSDPRLQQMVKDDTLTASITSSPPGATVDVQDYITPDGPWQRLGVTPLTNIQIPQGYFRWKVSKPGLGESISAPQTQSTMNFANFPLVPPQSAAGGMVPVSAGVWSYSIDFIGWVGPYRLPAYDVDRYEVTNREYQKFVDSHGYEKKEYWQEKFTQEGRELSWEEAVAKFRDTTDRPGPSTWVAGHYPEGQADYPVSGVSWFEASAYAAFAGKRLPVLAQWFKAAAPGLSQYTLPVSNISTNALAPVGAYKGIGLYGTYDMAGNVREWVANTVDNNFRFILGGSWKSPAYLYFDPEALSPFDRSDGNGFRCVLNHGPLPAEAEMPIHRTVRDFSTFKPVSDSVFDAYELLYAYPNKALNARVEGVVKETTDWREERITLDSVYSDERMAAYLFLPKKVRPPYQTILFFPSARVLYIPDNKGGSELGDIKFFDYIVQSGRAVIYPIYKGMYERRTKASFPGSTEWTSLVADQYKDAARSLYYLATRPDIDSSKLGYLGVSMGSADGVILSTLMRNRLKTAVFLDGGYFLTSPAPGSDMADFAPRLKLPVLMINGRYDFTFPVDRAQDPLFTMLGTPEKDKRHVIMETPHDVTEQRPQLVKEVLNWLDQYLGRVDE